MKFIPIEDLNKPCKAPRSRKEILAALGAKKQAEISEPKPLTREQPQEPDKEAELIEPAQKKSTRKSGPDVLPCGHNNWFTPTELQAAKDKDLCCPSGDKTFGKYKMPYWPYVTTHIPIIPVGYRRTKDAMWHGFCADEKGNYVGGRYNDCCELIKDKTKRCTAHREDAANKIE